MCIAVIKQTVMPRASVLSRATGRGTGGDALGGKRNEGRVDDAGVVGCSMQAT